ncbi:MAG: hypothetical protein ACK40U_10625, partial [Fervidobacterium pennivorans]
MDLEQLLKLRKELKSKYEEKKNNEKEEKKNNEKLDEFFKNKCCDCKSKNTCPLITNQNLDGFSYDWFNCFVRKFMEV